MNITPAAKAHLTNFLLKYRHKYDYQTVFIKEKIANITSDSHESITAIW